MIPVWNEKTLSELVRESVVHEMSPGSPLPDADVDLVKSEMLDSMGWVGVISALEKALGVRNFVDTWPEGKPQSRAALVQLAIETISRSEPAPVPAANHHRLNAARQIFITGWGSASGSLTIKAAEIESQFALPAGTIGERAGIRSVSRVARDEDEVSLGQAAANHALEVADVDFSELGLLVCTTATFLEFPSFAAALHNRLLLPESCSALDVGGACVGLVNALAAAKNVLTGEARRAALVVASEVHSRRLASSLEAGEFRGLFGDGACAFVLKSSEDHQTENGAFRIEGFVSGCSGSMSSALHLSLRADGAVDVTLNGEALGKSAVSTLNDVITKLENLSGVARSEVDCFAFHEPNPRLMAILAQRASIPSKKFAHTAETTGNLGSVTCGVNLCIALTRAHDLSPHNARQTIFVAAVGPGVLWSGTFLERDGELSSGFERRITSTS